MAPLTPFDPPLGPNPKFAFPGEETLQMKEKVFSLSGDDFTVNTVTGLEVCKCKGKVVSLSDASKSHNHHLSGVTMEENRHLTSWLEKFTDIQGHDLFTLKNTHFALNKSFHAQGPGGHDIFQVKGHFTGWYCPC